MTDYFLSKSYVSRCPRCENYVYLLGAELKDRPWFFICFPCKFVGHVGKGEVVEEFSQEESKVDDH